MNATLQWDVILTMIIILVVLTANNVVDASKAVWKALGVPESDWGEMDIYWSDA